MEWDVKEVRCSLPVEYQEGVLQLIERVFQASAVTRRTWEGLVGKLAFAGQIVPRGTLCSRSRVPSSVGGK